MLVLYFTECILTTDLKKVEEEAETLLACMGAPLSIVKESCLQAKIPVNDDKILSIGGEEDLIFKL